MDFKEVYPLHSFGSRFCMNILYYDDILHCLSFGDIDPNDVSHLYAHFLQLSTRENKGLSLARVNHTLQE